MSTLSIYFILDPLIELLPMPEFLENMFLELLSKHNVPTFLLLVVAAPVLEEMLCRGIILDGFLKRYTPQKAIIWSAVLFGVMHLNPWQFISAFGLGLYMGWLYYITGSLLSTVLVHAVANGFSFAVGYFYPDELKSTQELVGNNYIYAGILLVCILLLYTSMRLTRTLLRKKGYAQ
ncbi:MAG: CPBP family intramembrane glutamic endopeptidase [candidate division KSB1 bacterium]|nr:CPBP family intramembrane glutamic endopeptidase [candidate division KSB1 bacterium]